MDSEDTDLTWLKEKDYQIVFNKSKRYCSSGMTLSFNLVSRFVKFVYQFMDSCFSIA
jgi:hypothetical protein